MISSRLPRHLPRLVFACIGVLAATTGVAQPATAPGSGTLGQRFLEVRGGIEHTSDHLFEDKRLLGFRANVPVLEAVDFHFDYAYGRRDSETVPGMLAIWRSIERTEHAVQAGLTAYLARGALAPFLSLEGGQRWLRDETTSHAGIPVDKHDDSVWQAGVGVQCLAGNVAITPRIGYRSVSGDDFTTGTTASLEAHLWFTRHWGGFIGAEYLNAKARYYDDVWSGEAGLRVRF